MSETLEFVKQREANEEIIMQIYDMCNDKKEYKKFLSFCKDMGKEFKSLMKEKETKVYQVKKIKINENVSVQSCIMNFRPDSYNDTENPLEIKVTIADDSKNGLTSYGSSMFGGCNEAEYNEFLGLVSSGYNDFTKEF